MDAAGLAELRRARLTRCVPLGPDGRSAVEAAAQRWYAVTGRRWHGNVVWVRSPAEAARLGDPAQRVRAVHQCLAARGEAPSRPRRLAGRLPGAAIAGLRAAGPAALVPAMAAAPACSPARCSAPADPAAANAAGSRATPTATA